MGKENFRQYVFDDPSSQCGLTRSELRRELGSMYLCPYEEENEKYYNANEFLNEAEKRTLAFGSGK